MDGTGCDFLAVMLFLLVHFFVVRDIAWISHEDMVPGAEFQAVGLGAAFRSAQVAQRGTGSRAFETLRSRPSPVR